jgi:two-component system cell cycle response regulator
MTRRVLVVDDSEISRALIERVLAGHGFSVLTARDGAEAAVVALREHPDLVVTDLDMPVMNGYQLARLLKSDPASADIPLLVLTSHGDASSRFWGLETGADAYLVKDELGRGLLPAVEELLASAADRERLPVDPPQTPLEVLARVSRHLDSRLREAVLVNRILERGMQAKGIADAAQALMATVAEFVDADLLGLAMREPEESVSVHLKRAEGLADSASEELLDRLLAELGATADVAREVVVEPSPADGGRAVDLSGLELLPLPLRGAQGLLAVLPKRPFAEDGLERALLAELAGHLGLVLDNARLAQRLRELSMVDGLTRLLNRRTVHLRLSEELERARRYDLPLSLVLCDLDYFKSVNDTYGHLAGDSVLMHVADLLRQQARATDVMGRYGGEEFLILLPSTDAAEAKLAATRMREAIHSRAATLRDGTTLPVTASLGVASRSELSPDAAGPDALLALADKRLYEAKAAGRNRVVPEA